MTASNELTCKEFVELATDYFEGALSATERERFEAHLALCDGCEIYVEQLRQTIRLTGALAEESLSDEARLKLLASFRTWRTR